MLTTISSRNSNRDVFIDTPVPNEVGYLQEKKLKPVSDIPSLHLPHGPLYGLRYEVQRPRHNTGTYHVRACRRSLCFSPAKSVLLSET